MAVTLQYARLFGEVIDPELGINVVELGMVGPIEVAGGDVAGEHSPSPR